MVKEEVEESLLIAIVSWCVVERDLFSVGRLREPSRKQASRLQW